MLYAKTAAGAWNLLLNCLKLHPDLISQLFSIYALKQKAGKLKSQLSIRSKQNIKRNETEETQETEEIQSLSLTLPLRWTTKLDHRVHETVQKTTTRC